MERMHQVGPSVQATLELIAEFMQLTAADGEFPEYDQILYETRREEWLAFWCWWFVRLMFNASGYEHATDYAQMITDNLVVRAPPLARILEQRHDEYDSGCDSTLTLTQQGCAGFRAVLAHIDPDVPLPEDVSDEHLQNSFQESARLFEARTSWPA